MWNEIIYILMMLAGVGLFALGGTKIPILDKGYKWIRRFLFPFTMYWLLVWHGGFAQWQVLGSSLVLCGVLHLGYGDKTPWWEKALVGISYGLPSLFLGFTYWVFITPVIFLALFALSNWKATSKDFVWKVVEGLWGFILVATIIAAIQRSW